MNVRGQTRLYILPTGNGLLFAAALLVMLLGAINYNSGLGYLFTFLLTGLALVTILHTHRNLSKVELRMANTAPVFAGEPAIFQLCLANRSDQFRHDICVRIEADLASAHSSITEPVSLDAGLQNIELPFVTQQRGWLRLKPPQLFSTFPLGLFRVWTPSLANPACLVYPQPDGSLPLPAPCGGIGNQHGGGGGGDEDFSGFRQHQHGDSPRQVHWKAVAREQGMPVKLFSGGQPQELELGWEMVPLADPEQRLAQLCRWLLTAEEQGYRYRLSLPNGRSEMDHGSAQLYVCLKMLALYPATS